MTSIINFLVIIGLSIVVFILGYLFIPILSIFFKPLIVISIFFAILGLICSLIIKIMNRSKFYLYGGIFIPLPLIIFQQITYNILSNILSRVTEADQYLNEYALSQLPLIFTYVNPYLTLLTSVIFFNIFPAVFYIKSKDRSSLALLLYIFSLFIIYVSVEITAKLIASSL